MPNASSFKLAASLFLARQTILAASAPVAAPSPTNHIVVIDCSGSMYGELPAIRAQLKKKLPKLLSEQDTLSIVWFSGRGQYGTLVEAEPVATLTDLQAVESAIDRWLKPCGLTGFKEPLNEVKALAARIAKARPNSVFSLFFMSDGCDNQWSRPEILKVVDDVAGGFSAATFVEYGYYADRVLLTAMAERAGGSLIHAKDFDSYQPAFEAAMAKRPMGGKRIEVPVEGNPVGGFVYTLSNGDLVTYAVTDGKVQVPEGTATIYYVNPTSVGTVTDAYEVPAAYAAMSLYAVRMNPDVVLALLKATGDVAFIEQFGGLFGKQKYSEFMDAAKAAAFDDSKRMTKGFDPNKVPREDAFTVLDFLRVLASDDDNRVLLDHEAFKYNRIGRGTVDATSVLTDDEQAEVEKLTAEMGKTKDAKKVAEFAAKIAAISNKPEALKFVAAPAPEGYAVSNLTYNEDRPNISILVRKPGTVDLSSRKDLPAGVPTTFETFVYRNYAVVKDGLVNVKVLPCKLSAATVAMLFDESKAGRLPDDVVICDGDVILVHLDKLPVINRKMVKAVNAQDFFAKAYALTKAQAEAKVFATTKKEQFPKVSKGFVETYGEAAAAWLKEQGFTDYSGFGPKRVQAEATDFYMGKELKVSLKGLSSLPTLKAARESIVKGKVNAPTALMQTAINALDAFLATKPDAAALEAYLDNSVKTYTALTRGLIREIAEATFTMIVGQTWLFPTLDENTMTITVNGATVECKAEMKEVEVKI